MNYGHACDALRGLGEYMSDYEQFYTQLFKIAIGKSSVGAGQVLPASLEAAGEARDFEVSRRDGQAARRSPAVSGLEGPGVAITP